MRLGRPIADSYIPGNTDIGGTTGITWERTTLCTFKSRQPQFIYIFCLFILAVTAHAESVPLWGRWEQTFYADATAPPETELVIELTSPSGRVFTRAGFWDGEQRWRVRFMPVEAGTWLYRTHSVPVLDGLDGKRGEFICQQAAGDTRFLKHGPVRVSANGRFFEHADGTPFFWMGDTVWYGPILSSNADWNTYLADRKAKHFDVVHFNVVAPRNGLAADENGEISFVGGDPARVTAGLNRILTPVYKALGANSEHIRMNPLFYQRLDERIDAINSHGLLAAIVLTWGLRPEDSGNFLPESEVVRLIRYIEARYGANHVVWILTGDNAYEGASGERWKGIGRAAFGERDHAPVTTHPIGMNWPWENFRDEKWLDFIVYQSGHGDDANTLHWIHSGPPSQHWQEPPTRPFINLEPPYEGHRGYQSLRPHSDYSTRRAIYWSLLNAPTAGVSYGAHGVWSWQTAVGQPPTDHADTGVAKTWREALSLPGSSHMRYLEAFFSSIAWWKLQPDSNLLVEQPEGDEVARHVSASSSHNRDLAVIYLPNGGNVRLTESAVRDGANAEWFDPRTGKRTLVERPLTTEFAAPNGQDWVLLLRNE